MGVTYLGYWGTLCHVIAVTLQNAHYLELQVSSNFLKTFLLIVYFSQKLVMSLSLTNYYSSFGNHYRFWFQLTLIK